MRMTVASHEFDMGGGRHVGFRVITAGEITGSEDLRVLVKKGKVAFELDADGQLCIAEKGKSRKRFERPATFDM